MMIVSSPSSSSSSSSSSLSMVGGFGFVDAVDNGSSSSVLKQLREKYDDLPEQGKFVTGAVVGYGGSKLVTKSAVTVVKFAGAAFVA
jgi:hypothetical protein